MLLTDEAFWHPGPMIPLIYCRWLDKCFVALEATLTAVPRTLAVYVWSVIYSRVYTAAPVIDQMAFSKRNA